MSRAERSMDASDEGEEEIEIVIVGGGISGLATALALHRKGISSVVLERSDHLRATGAAIAILANGWRALHHLGIDSTLRQPTIPLFGVRDISLDKGTQREAPISHGEYRCVKRSELVEALAGDLPPGTIRFGCRIVSVKLDSVTSLPVIQLHGGSIIKAKVLIGCDGANSVVSEFLELKPKKLFSTCAVRGYTNYPNGHGFPPQFVRTSRGSIVSGRAPINDNLVYCWVNQPCHQLNLDSKAWKDPDLIREMIVDTVKGFPNEVIEVMKECDLNSLSLTQLRYRVPWELVVASYRKGTVTVAGDAMHEMLPFLGQGGSSGMEDGIVLARCLARKMNSVREIEEAIDEYVRERRVRLLRLSAQSYLAGLRLSSSSVIVKFLIFLVMFVFFRDQIGHTDFDCGSLH